MIVSWYLSLDSSIFAFLKSLHRTRQRGQSLELSSAICQNDFDVTPVPVSDNNSGVKNLQREGRFFEKSAHQRNLTR